VSVKKEKKVSVNGKKEKVSVNGIDIFLLESHKGAYEQLLFVFFLPLLIQQPVQIVHASHRELRCNPRHRQQRLVPQPHCDIQLLDVDFVLFTRHRLGPTASAQLCYAWN
jgi:hypothetical protein